MDHRPANVFLILTFQMGGPPVLNILFDETLYGMSLV